jgi:hypothetical protein
LLHLRNQRTMVSGSVLVENAESLLLSVYNSLIFQYP